MSRVELGKDVRESVIHSFRLHRDLAEKAMAQMAPEDLDRMLDAESNSVATLMKHVSGNLLSRWSDIFESDGEKPTRDRDAEFDPEVRYSPEELRHRWALAWDRLLETLSALSVSDLEKTITIRGEPHTVVQAMERSLAHTAYHVGQIVFLAKHLSSARWQNLSMPRPPRR